MSNLRKTAISNPEKEFLIKSLKEWMRIDGRAFHEYRNIQIDFGKDWGCCFVSLGKTRVIAQVTCELQQPKSSRPSEGILNLNLELNPMADPNFEAGRQSELSSQLNRLLEKSIKDSKAIDLESLCVKMNEKVWSFRVDINVLNYEGNLLDCAAIAALSALAHFRRPDVSSDGMDFKIHSLKERDPIPTVVYHYPVCITYAIFCGGEFVVIDPTFLEEGVSEAFLCVGLNSYKELCGLHLGGKAQLSPEIILETTNKAVKVAANIVEIIKNAVEKDTNEKLALKDTGFQHLDFNVLTAASFEGLNQCLERWDTSSKTKKKKKNKRNTKNNYDDEDKMDTELINNNMEINSLDNKTAEMIPTQETEAEWVILDSDDDNDGNVAQDVVCIEPSVEIIKVEGSESEEENVIVTKPIEKRRKVK